MLFRSFCCPATVTVSKCNTGKVSGRGLLVGSISRSILPVGTLSNRKKPSSLVVPVAGLLGIETTAPGIAVKPLSSTTPEKVVSSGLPGVKPDEVKVAGRLDRPGKVALTTLLLMPGSSPRVNTARAMPSVPVCLAIVALPSKFPCLWLPGSLPEFPG